MRFLPLADDAPHERSDAARNRQALLAAATELVRRDGADAVTMEDVAARAGVGKGTVFRRFGSREGLMAAVLNHSEAVWQAEVLSGPPPLGPGAPPLDRLLALGRSRMELNLTHAQVIAAAGHAGSRSIAAESFVAMHVRYLLGELGVRGDLTYLAAALLSPLEVPVLMQQTRTERLPVERLHEGWADLARRVVSE